LNEYKVGLLGIGDIALEFHIPAIQAIDNCKIIAACDNDFKILEGIDGKYNIKNLYLNYKDMLDSECLDIVIISTPNKFHAEHSIYSLSKGFNVLVEKPLAVNYEESINIENAALINKKSIMCLHHNRFKDCSIQSKKIIDSGKIGNIFYSKASILLSDNLPKKSHYLESTSIGGGPLYDVGYHLIDLAWWMMGGPKPSYALGKLWNHNASKNSDLSKCEDFAIGNIYFENGTTLLIEASYSAKLEDDLIECTFFGEKGSLTWPNDYFFLKEKHNVLKIKVPSNDKQIVATVEQIRYFLKMLDESVEPYIESSSTVVSLIEKIIESSNTKKITYFK
jgi:predicted dehydrogenase